MGCVVAIPEEVAMKPALIDRWREHLPFAPDDPVVSLSRATRR